LATSLTLASIALSVALLLGVENVRSGMRESFSNTISRTDLIVGAARRIDPAAALLGVRDRLAHRTTSAGTRTSDWRDHPAVAWTIPYSLGDSHRGFRVDRHRQLLLRALPLWWRARSHSRRVQRRARITRSCSATRLRRSSDTRSGRTSSSHMGCTARASWTTTRRPFRVVGILDRTFTPVDRSLYVTLEGVEAMHADFMSDPFGAGGSPDFSTTPPSFAAPAADASAEAEEAHAHDAAAATESRQITSFFLGARTRIATLQLQREINTFADEPVMAILPGVALAEMWRGVGYAEDALLVVTFFVVAVGLIGMLLSLYSSLEARRREMAILRAVGAGAPKIFGLLVLESGLLGLAGAVSGVALIYALLVLLKGFVESNFGLYLPIQPPTRTAWVYLAAVVVASFVIGIVPAVKAYRNSLSDGLTVRV
jgi:putative ABC transport system permease protein